MELQQRKIESVMRGRSNRYLVIGFTQSIGSCSVIDPESFRVFRVLNAWKKGYRRS